MKLADVSRALPDATLSLFWRLALPVQISTLQLLSVPESADVYASATVNVHVPLPLKPLKLASEPLGDNVPPMAGEDELHCDSTPLPAASSSVAKMLSLLQPH